MRSCGFVERSFRALRQNLSHTLRRLEDKRAVATPQIFVDLPHCRANLELTDQHVTLDIDLTGVHRWLGIGHRGWFREFCGTRVVHWAWKSGRGGSQVLQELARIHFFSPFASSERLFLELPS